MIKIVAGWMILMGVVNTFSTIALIGKERKPITAMTANVNIVVNAMMIAAVCYLAWWSR